MARSWRSQIADEVRACSMMKPKDDTRPAAPVEGLETVTYRGKYIADDNGAWDHYPSADVSFDPDKYEQEALVTRSQAEAIIAAERAQTDAYCTALMLIREGCENPSEIARNTLERFGK